MWGKGGVLGPGALGPPILVAAWPRTPHSASSPLSLALFCPFIPPASPWGSFLVGFKGWLRAPSPAVSESPGHTPPAPGIWTRPSVSVWGAPSAAGQMKGGEGGPVPLLLSGSSLLSSHTSSSNRGAAGPPLCQVGGDPPGRLLAALRGPCWPGRGRRQERLGPGCISSLPLQPRPPLASGKVAWALHLPLPWTLGISRWILLAPGQTDTFSGSPPQLAGAAAGP